MKDFMSKLKEKVDACANEAELDAVMNWAVKVSLFTSKPPNPVICGSPPWPIHVQKALFSTFPDKMGIGGGGGGCRSHRKGTDQKRDKRSKKCAFAACWLVLGMYY